MSLLSPISAGLPRDKKEAAAALESMILKQMLQASGAFKGSSEAGSSLHADLFADTLADAVSRAGGLGLAAALEASLGGTPAPPSALGAPGTLAALTAGPAHITSQYGTRSDPFDGHSSEHRGVDVGAPEGSPILAAAGGVVRRAGDRGGYGMAVEIQHEGGVSTLYAHASELLVREGDRVEPGQAIARVGQSGRATGPHLHFEVREAGRPVDPARALKAYGFRADTGGERDP